jgi:tripeptidyl-peptidase-1
MMCGVYNPTNVISISYGTAEFDLPANYQERQCNEFLKLGLQGHTVLYAAGDYGVAAESPSGCLGDNGKVFGPEYPS